MWNYVQERIKFSKTHYNIYPRSWAKVAQVSISFGNYSSSISGPYLWDRSAGVLRPQSKRICVVWLCPMGTISYFCAFFPQTHESWRPLSAQMQHCACDNQETFPVCWSAGEGSAKSYGSLSSCAVCGSTSRAHEAIAVLFGFPSPSFLPLPKLGLGSNILSCFLKNISLAEPLMLLTQKDNYVVDMLPL